MDKNAAMIETVSLSFSYQQAEESEKTVLSGIDLQIPKGQFVVVLGHNGSGKSTLAKHFNSILLPCGGKVFIDGMDSADEELTFEIRKRCGMVFQNPDNQIVATITEEDVAFGPENLGIEPKEIRKRVDDALKTVGMFDLRMQAPHMLSGGQKQRVAIAGIIAMQPDCIVLDEPTAMLDPKGRRDVIDTITRLNKELGITIVLITHHMEEAINADRVIVMSNGKITLDGTPKEIFINVGTLRECGLDVPQTVELLYSLKRAGYDVSLDALSIDECVDEIINKVL